MAEDLSGSTIEDLKKEALAAKARKFGVEAEKLAAEAESLRSPSTPMTGWAGNIKGLLAFVPPKWRPWVLGLGGIAIAAEGAHFVGQGVTTVPTVSKAFSDSTVAANNADATRVQVWDILNLKKNQVAVVGPDGKQLQELDKDGKPEFDATGKPVGATRPLTLEEVNAAKNNLKLVGKDGEPLAGQAFTIFLQQTEQLYKNQSVAQQAAQSKLDYSGVLLANGVAGQPMTDAQAAEAIRTGLGPTGKPLMNSDGKTPLVGDPRAGFIKQFSDSQEAVSKKAQADFARPNQWMNIIKTGFDALSTTLGGIGTVAGSVISYGLLAVGAGFVLNWAKDTQWGQRHAWVGKAADMINRGESAVGSFVERIGSTSESHGQDQGATRTQADPILAPGEQPTNVAMLTGPMANRRHNKFDDMAPALAPDNDNYTRPNNDNNSKIAMAAGAEVPPPSGGGRSVPAAKPLFPENVIG